MIWLKLIVASTLWAQDVPFFPRGTDANQDLGAINQNYRELAAKSTNRTTTTITPDSCPAGYALTGATYSNGSVVGGTCTSVSSSSSGSVNSSTGAFIPGNSTLITPAALGPCVANSTVTFTTTSTAKHLILSSVNIRQGNSGDHIQCGVLQNGAFIEQQTSAKGIWVGHGQGSPSFMEMNFSYLTQSTYPAGTYSYCITCGIDGSNSFQFCSNALPAGTGTCTFNVSEFK